MKKWFYIVVVLLTLSFSLSLQAAVTATVNKNVLASGDTLQLRIQRDGSADGQPDISALKKDFDVLGSSRGSNVQIINGHMSTQTQITVLLAPKHDGKIVIPPLQWGNEQSAAIELTVGGSGGGGTAQQGGGQGNGQAANENSHVYLTTALDQKQPYVQAAVVLTVRLYSDQALYQASLDFPASSDVLVKPLGKDVQTNEMHNGRNYQIVERKYLLFPQRSGKLSLNGPVLDAQVPDSSNNDPFDNIFRQMPFGGMVNSTRPIRVHAKSIELNVLPRPAGSSSAIWLPAQKVTLEENWRQDMSTIHVGEPLTRHFHIEALGLTGAQLPDPNSFMTVPEGIKAYPDQSTVTDNPQGNSVLGTRDQNIALIASRTGHFELPAVRLSWWDTVHNEKREITLPSHTLDVLPAVAGSGTMTMSPAMTEPSLLLNQGEQLNTNGEVSKISNNPVWMWLSLILGLLWIGTSMAWWRDHLRGPRPKASNNIAEKKSAVPRSGSEFKALKLACNNNDPHAARQQMLAWASTFWPDAPPHGLNELARHFADTSLIEALRQLDRACYTGNAWDGTLLLQSLPESPVHASVKESKQVLPQLYR
jgi:hypothetical protein